MNTTLQLVARYKAAGFIPDKFWKEETQDLKRLLDSPMDSPIDVSWGIRDVLQPFFGLFQDRLLRYGLNRHAEYSVKSRIEILFDGQLSVIGDRYSKLESELKDTPVERGSALEEIQLGLESVLNEVFKKSIPTLGKALKVVWTIPPGSILALAQKILKRATPEEINALEQVAAGDYSSKLLDLKYKFLQRVDYEGSAKKLVKREKIDRDLTKWIMSLKDMLVANYGQEEVAKGFDEFQIGNLKAVILDPMVSLHEASWYVKRFGEARALLKQKGLEKLWYGVMFVKSREYKQLDPASQKAYQDLGYENIENQAGTYHSGEDIVKITAPPNGDLARVIVHEMGHRYWFKFLKPEQRARFNGLIRTNPSKDVRDFPSGPSEDGVEKPVTPVSDYGKSTIEEAFAEVFEHYVNGKDMNRDQLESFRSVLARAIPLDKQSIMRFTELVEKELAELAAQQEGPFGRKTLGQWPYEIRAVDGTTIRTVVGLKSVPMSGTAIFGDAGVGHQRGTPVVIVEVNGSIDADVIRRSAETHIVKLLLFNTLIHELTHVADKYTKGVGEGAKGLTMDQARNTPEGYYNNPTEVRAYMQEVVDQVSQRFVHYEKLEKRFGQKALGMLLNMSDTWGKVSPYWTERNKQKVLKSVYQALDEWKQSKTATGRVVARYKAAMSTTVITPEAVEKWRKDLRVMTKIYKSIDGSMDERNLERWDEAEKLFRIFREKFDHWIYKVVLPRVEQDKETYVHTNLRKEAWTALYTITNSTLFPTSWNYKTDTYDRAPYQLVKDQALNLRRYQGAFNKALKTLDEFVADAGGSIQRPVDETFEVAGMTVIVQGYGRGEYEDDMEVFFRGLRNFVKPVLQAGFKSAVWGMKVLIDFNPGPKDGLTNAKYIVSKDQMLMYPLGMVGSSGGTVAHEIGHRYWFREMSNQARAYWVETMESRGSKIEKKDLDSFFKAFTDHFRRELDSGSFPERDEAQAFVRQAPVDELLRAKYRVIAAIPGFYSLKVVGTDQVFDYADFRKRLDIYEDDVALVEEISEYAASGGPVEAFAEVFRIYCTRGPGALGPATLDLFKKVVASGGVKLAACRLVARFASRSKKISLGFWVVDIRTGEPLSDIFGRRDPARDEAKKLHESGRNVGVQTIEAHVPSDWKKGDSLEGYVDAKILEALKRKR